MRRSLPAGAAATVALLLVGGPAWAFFTAQTSVTQATSASTLNAGNTPSGAVSGRDVTVTWPASLLTVNSSGAPVTYTVSRYVNGVLDTTMTGGCAGTVSALTCVDTSVGAGSYTYRVTPYLSSWTAGASPFSVTATVAPAALALSPASTTTDGGTVSATASGYRDGEVVTFCRQDPASTTCSSLATSTTPVTVPPTGGAVTVSLTIPAGLALGTYNVLATGSLGTSTSATLSVGVGAAARLVFGTQPAGAVAGSVFTTAPVVSVADAHGNPVTTSTTAVSLAIGTNPSSGTLSGCTPATSSGQTTFTGCSINNPGSGYPLIATSGSLSATSSPFTVADGYGIMLTELKVGGIAATTTCGPVSNNRTCTTPSTNANGNGRNMSLRVTLVDKLGANRINSGTSAANVHFDSYTVTSGSKKIEQAPDPTTIAAGASSTDVIAYPIVNGSATEHLTMTVTLAGQTYVITIAV